MVCNRVLVHALGMLGYVLQHVHSQRSSQRLLVKFVNVLKTSVASLTLPPLSELKRNQVTLLLP